MCITCINCVSKVKSRIYLAPFIQKFPNSKYYKSLNLNISNNIKTIPCFLGVYFFISLLQNYCIQMQNWCNIRNTIQVEFVWCYKNQSWHLATSVSANNILNHLQVLSKWVTNQILTFKMQNKQPLESHNSTSSAGIHTLSHNDHNNETLHKNTLATNPPAQKDWRKNSDNTQWKSRKYDQQFTYVHVMQPAASEF